MNASTETKMEKHRREDGRRGEQIEGDRRTGGDETAVVM